MHSSLDSSYSVNLSDHPKPVYWPPELPHFTIDKTKTAKD